VKLGCLRNPTRISAVYPRTFGKSALQACLLIQPLHECSAPSLLRGRQYARHKIRFSDLHNGACHMKWGEKGKEPESIPAGIFE